MLELSHVTVRYGSLTIVDDVSFTLEDGHWLMIVGPNGAGKSTLLSAVSQGAPYSGQVLIDGADAALLKPRQLARKLAVLAQSYHVGYSFTVEEVVKLGRYSYGGGSFALREQGGEDREQVRRALELTGLTPLAGQSVLTLSGGELQRAFLAQILAQDAQMLLLDEPTNHLDLVYQQQIFELIRDWIALTGRSVISVVHDLNLARAYGSEVLLMQQGSVVAYGGVEQVLTRENLRSVYKLDVYQWMNDMLARWQ
ncbi:MAG: ABC transporter ATP-binding protein [Bacillota bacterium]|nr:ABC transporter ATP-binding protein [Bacillota bacterium]